MSPLTFGDEVLRLIIAMVLGVVIGWEREAVGKDAGVRTTMLVCIGATLFTIISIILPSILGVDISKVAVLSDRVIANVVVGIGFLGGGIIIKSGEHVKGLTTAALVWTTSAIGILVGMGQIRLAATATVAITVPLWILRKINLRERIRNGNGHSENGGGK